MPRRNGKMLESAKNNKRSWTMYYNRLMELSISMFEWQNVPDTVDTRFLELALFGTGMAVFFYDEVMGYLCLNTMIGGRLDVYRIPIERTAYSQNGYNRRLDNTDSVIIFNNMLHTNSTLEVENFSRRLWQLDRAIDVNTNAQKTPILIQCTETQRLSLVNLYMQYDGNEPVIFADNALDPNNAIRAINTGAPYVADSLYTLKTQLWNEALTYLGISNINLSKKERLITDEVIRNQGSVMASRYSRLNARRQACEQINRMFGLDMWVNYREDYRLLDKDDSLKDVPTEEERPKEEGENNE